jgi:hypothetical protein
MLPAAYILWHNNPVSMSVLGTGLSSGQQHYSRRRTFRRKNFQVLIRPLWMVLQNGEILIVSLCAAGKSGRRVMLRIILQR